MRRNAVIRFGVFAAAVTLAGVGAAMASVALLGSTNSDDTLGRLSPVQDLALEKDQPAIGGASATSSTPPAAKPTRPSAPAQATKQRPKAAPPARVRPVAPPPVSRPSGESDSSGKGRGRGRGGSGRGGSGGDDDD